MTPSATISQVIHEGGLKQHSQLFGKRKSGRRMNIIMEASRDAEVRKLLPLIIFVVYRRWLEEATTAF